MTKSDVPQRKALLDRGWWVYGLIFVLVAAGLAYVLFGASGGASGDRTALGGVSLDFIQRTLQDSADSPIFAGLALAAAFVLGALHALTPGHNKTLVGAYLVGARARLRHAFLIGMVAAFSHTASALVIGVLAVSTTGQIASSQYFKWIGLPSGLLTILLGLYLLRKSLRPSVHGHDHGHAHGDAHDDQPHDHSHAQEHDHNHGHGHSHAAPDGITLGGLVVLGLMHGIVPTFDALAVVLVALTLNKIALGIGLILAYSLGSGSVMVAVGALLVRAQSALLDHPRFDWVAHRAPAIAAGLVIVLGIALVVRTAVGT